jgi:hypothetical protein
MQENIILDLAYCLLYKIAYIKDLKHLQLKKIEKQQFETIENEYKKIFTF